jgi:hypothetical protein
LGTLVWPLFKTIQILISRVVKVQNHLSVTMKKLPVWLEASNLGLLLTANNFEGTLWLP